MIPSILMNLDFAARAEGSPEPGPDLNVGMLLLMGVGRMVIPFILLLKALEALKDAG